jgi:hypothetical protein
MVTRMCNSQALIYFRSWGSNDGGIGGDAGRSEEAKKEELVKVPWIEWEQPRWWWWFTYQGIEYGIGLVGSGLPRGLRAQPSL